MNDIIVKEIKRFDIIRKLTKDELNLITNEYKNLSIEEQTLLNFLWLVEEEIIKNKLKQEGKSSKDITEEDTYLYKGLKVEGYK